LADFFCVRFLCTLKGIKFSKEMNKHSMNMIQDIDSILLLIFFG
jgi:hypothetical protein